VARFVSALVVLPVVALAAAGCGGGMQASSAGSKSLSISCSTRSDASSSANLLWVAGKQPLVYYVQGRKVFSSAGRGAALPQSAIPVGFRACSKPLLLYTLGTELRATALTGGRQTLTLGQRAFVAPGGGLVTYSGMKIKDAAGSSFLVRGLPANWLITSVVASPSNPHAFLVSAQSPEAGLEMCGKGLGGVYLASPSGSKTVLVDNPCHDHPQAGWSPNGSTISYVGGSSKDVYALDSNGSHLRRVTSAGQVVRYLWSPTGTKIVFATNRGSAAVVAASGGSTRSLGRGAPLAWSPDGHEVAFVAAGKPVIEAVSATGGRSSHVLLRLRKS
jgi:hypothetical protein